jgi:hypothetical protein
VLPPPLLIFSKQAQKNQPKRTKNFFGGFLNLQNSFSGSAIITKKSVTFPQKRNSHNNNHVTDSYDKKNDQVDLGSFADNMLSYAKYLCW